MGRRKSKIMDTVDKIDKDKLIKHIIRWLDDNDNFDNNKNHYHYENQLARHSQELKEKIRLYMEGIDEFN